MDKRGNRALDGRPRYPEHVSGRWAERKTDGAGRKSGEWEWSGAVSGYSRKRLSGRERGAGGSVEREGADFAERWAG